jgi:hypothetical protein
MRRTSGPVRAQASGAIPHFVPQRVFPALSRGLRHSSGDESEDRQCLPSEEDFYYSYAHQRPSFRGTCSYFCLSSACRGCVCVCVCVCVCGVFTIHTHTNAPLSEVRAAYTLLLCLSSALYRALKGVCFRGSPTPAEHS